MQLAYCNVNQTKCLCCVLKCYLKTRHSKYFLAQTMQLVCQLREKDEADSGADHVMFLEVGSKTEDTRLALITLSVSLKNCYLEKNLEKSDRAVRYQLVNLVGRTHITHILPGQNFCIIINCSRKFTIWQKPPHISNFSRCFPTQPDCLILTSNSMEISKINI